MKKYLALFLVLILSLSMLTACGGNDPVEPPVDEPMEKTVVTFTMGADSTGALAAITKAFNEQSEMVEVNLIELTNDTGQMHDLLINSLSSGSGEYDAVAMDVVWAGEFAAAGYLEPLDGMIKDAGWEISDFNAGSMASGKYKGKTYVMPFFPDLGFLYYRSDIVSEENAMKLESGDYTWEELLAMAEMYVGDMETKYGHVYQSKQYEGLTCNINEFSDNWQDVRGGLERMKMFTDSDATPKDVLTFTEGETHNAFISGESVFARNWPYMNGMIATGENNVKLDQVGYAPLPQGGTVGGWIIGINKNSENMEAAQEFLMFISGEEGQKINATVGRYLPGINALLTDPEILATNPLLSSEAFTRAVSTTIARPVAANYSEVSDVIQLNTHAYLSGNTDLDTAVMAIEEALGQ